MFGGAFFVRGSVLRCKEEFKLHHTKVPGTITEVHGSSIVNETVWYPV